MSKLVTELLAHAPANPVELSLFQTDGTELLRARSFPGFLAGFQAGFMRCQKEGVVKSEELERVMGIEPT